MSRGFKQRDLTGTGGVYFCPASAASLHSKKAVQSFAQTFIFLGSTLNLITYLSSCQSICAGKTGQLDLGRTCSFCFCPKGQW